uniref:Cysteine proteinase inhibitor n=1 Tax=Rhizophora mucronata TaxID=61149 RepID=A0A2P2JJF2_RHIMU
MNRYIMKRNCLLRCLVFIAAVAVSAVDLTEAALVGGWKPIRDLNDPHVQDIGSYAVGAYNKRSNADLKFQRAVKGETQVVSGMNYRLVLAVKDGGADKQYQAVVWEKAWEHFRNLTSFKPWKA